jgi:hypothetical protein
MKTRNPILPLAALAGLALLAAPANATIITPTTATVAVGGSTNTVITSTIDSSGLSGGGISGDILSETHDFGGGQWISGNGTSPNVEVVFDLDGTFTVDSVHLWNFHWSNGVTHWGTQTLDISFSTDGGSNYSNTVQDLAFTRAVTAVPIPVQTQTFAAVSGVTHIKVSDLVYFDAGPYVGFAEIRFGGAATPTTSGTLIYGK